MKSSKKLQILKVEGLDGNRGFSCVISQNTKQLKHFMLEQTNEAQEVECSGSGMIEIRIMNLMSSSSSLSTLSSKSLMQSFNSTSSTAFAVNICPSQIKPNETWFALHPLFSAHSQADDSKPLKILIKGRLSPEENNESDDYQEAYESFASELVLASMIESPSIDSEELLGRSDLQSKCKKQSMIIKVITKQLEISNEKNLQLLQKVELIESKLSKSCEQLSSSIETSNEREKALISIISQKDLEYQQSLNQNLQLQAKCRTLENEKEHLNDQVHRLELELERLNDTEKELLQTNRKLQRSESIQDQLNKTIMRLSKSINDDPEATSNNQILLRDAEIQMLKNVTEEVKKSADMQILSLTQEILELKAAVLRTQEQEKMLASKLKNLDSDKQGANVDAAFADAMQRLRLSYRKVKDFMFEVNGKVVNVAVCRTGVLAKVGSSLLSFEEFFEEFLGSKSPRPEVCYSVMTDRTNENGERRVSRVTSQKTFLKGTQSSLNKSKLVPERTPSRTRVKSIERKPFR